jgi:two-component system response regulator PhoP
VRVLIIEDEKRLAGNIARSLREGAGYAVDCSYDGEEGLFMAGSNPYDLVILDLMLPRIDGLSVLSRMRAAGNASPVLVLTARDERDSVVELLNAGADDYVTKPFDLGELIARAKALIRRGKGQSAGVLKVRDLEIDVSARRVIRNGKPVALTAMEYRVLEYLAHRPNAIVSKAELLEHLYDFNWERFSNVIEVYVSGLRRKLDDRDGELIQTSRGQGYVLCS